MKEIFEFFEDLGANNNREWFQAHKHIYDGLRREWVAGLGKIIQIIGEWWPEVRYQDPSRSTYRIYRDVRFSNDKTPYKTHISSSIYNPALRGMHTGVYIEAGAGKGAPGTGVWGGIWCPDSAVLRKIRQAIADNAEEFTTIADDPQLHKYYGSEWFGDRLKTAPKGFDKDHPMIEYLRLKDIGKFHPVSRDTFSRNDWPEAIAESIRPVLPLVKFIDYSIIEDL